MEVRGAALSEAGRTGTSGFGRAWSDLRKWTSSPSIEFRDLLITLLSDVLTEADLLSEPSVLMERGAATGFPSTNPWPDVVNTASVKKLCAGGGLVCT